MHHAEEIIIVAGHDVASVVRHNVGAHPDEDPMLCDLWRYDVAPQARECGSQGRARAPMQPPVLVHETVSITIAERFHMSADKLKGQFVESCVRFRHIAKIHQPASLVTLDNIPANHSPLHYIRIRPAIRVELGREHDAGLLFR